MVHAKAHSERRIERGVDLRVYSIVIEHLQRSQPCQPDARRPMTPGDHVFLLSRGARIALLA